MSSAAQIELDAVEQVAQRYVDRGYAITRDVDVPGVGVADLLASRGDERVLIEVRGTEGGTPLARLAEYASRHGWRMVIAVPDARGSREVELPTNAEVLEQITEASSLKPSSAAHVLLSWSILEAAARIALTEFGVALSETSPRSVIQQLALRGLVTPDEERELVALLQQRNHAAHGQWRHLSPAVSSEFAIELARRLLAARALSRVSPRRSNRLTGR